MDDLAVGKCISFPPPLLARSKAAAYHVSSGQCNTTPAKQARHSGVGWHVFVRCERLMLQLRCTMMGGGDRELQSVCFYPGVLTVSVFLTMTQCSAGLLSQDTRSKTAIEREALNWSFFLKVAPGVTEKKKKKSRVTKSSVSEKRVLVRVQNPPIWLCFVDVLRYSLLSALWLILSTIYLCHWKESWDFNPIIVVYWRVMILTN